MGLELSVDLGLEEAWSHVQARLKVGLRVASRLGFAARLGFLQEAYYRLAFRLGSGSGLVLGIGLGLTSRCWRKNGQTIREGLHGRSRWACGLAFC